MRQREYFQHPLNAKWNFGLMLLALLTSVCLIPADARSQPRKSPSQKPRKVDGVKQYTIEQFMDTTWVGGSSFSPDEKSIMFHSNKTGIFNVYTVPITGGAPRLLTNSTKESIFSVSFFPRDRRFIYTYDRGGDENSHLYVRDESGQELDLTPGDKVKANFIDWSHDRKSFFYSANGRDPRFFDIYEMSLADLKPVLLYKDETGYQIGDISKDKRYIVFVKPNTTADADLYLYNTETKGMKHLTPHAGDINFRPQAFDVNSKHLYYLTDEGSEYKYIARYNLATGKSEVVEKAPWDIIYTQFSQGGKYRVVAINEEARTKIKVYEQSTGKLIPLPQLPGGDIAGVTISPSERLMAFYLDGDRSPSNLYVYDFASKKVTQLTDSLNPEIDPADLVDTQMVRYKSFDGTEVPAILYKPHQASASNRVPAIVRVHGGPGGQARAGYKAQIQFLVNNGYVVLDINHRGSGGYGKTFFTADDGRHGREPLWDCVEAKKYLASLGYVDEQKIGIMGGSYGGYMVLAALAFKPEEFAVGIDIFGISNWVRTLQSVPPYWEAFRKALYKEIGDPATEMEKLRAISPLFHAEQDSQTLACHSGGKRRARPQARIG